MSTTNSHPTGEETCSNPDSAAGIMRSTSIMALGTLVSRVLGFFRDMAFAFVMGTGMYADAFFVAFRIPNLLRDFVGEGATNAAVVPVLTEHDHISTRKEFWSFVNIVFALAALILAAITILGMLFAPAIVRVMVPGFISDPVKLDVTITLTRILFPYLLLIGLTAFLMGVFYVFRSFVVPAASPCLLNIAMIVSVLLALRLPPAEAVFYSAWGVLVGGVLQLSWHVFALWRRGMRFSIPVTMRHPGATQMGKLLVPRMVGSGVYQLNLVVDSLCASLSQIVGQGGISAIYFANRLVQLPMGLFGVALSSAVLPTLSRFFTRHDHDSMRKTLLFSLENILFVMVPSTVLLVILAEPCVKFLFERGAFDAYSTGITSTTTVYYALGLFSFGMMKILVTAFYAMKDTRTPVRVAMQCLVFNAALNVLLMGPLKIGGIALASSIAAAMNAWMLLLYMERRVGPLKMLLGRYFLKVFAAACVMAAVVGAVWMLTASMPAIARIVLAASFGLCCYQWVAVIVHIPQAKKVSQWVLRRQ